MQTISIVVWKKNDGYPFVPHFKISNHVVQNDGYPFDSELTPRFDFKSWREKPIERET